MKVLGFMPIHYGQEYLEAALQAAEPFVDAFVIAYTPRPSYSHQGSLKCPESRSTLSSIANGVLKGKLIWVDGTYNGEGEHRNIVNGYLRDYDMIWSIDADEVWDRPDLAIQEAWDNPCIRVGVGGDCWLHMWRSFNEANTDGFYPMRFQKREGVEFSPDKGIIHSGKVYHFGYAQSEAITRYKISCHGHKNEWKPNWLEEKWINYQRGVTEYLHPTTNAYWKETITVDKEQMPQVLKDHKNFNLDKII